jgi:hypothetical protein
MLFFSPPPRPTLAIAVGESCRCFCHTAGPFAESPYELTEYDASPVRINDIGNRVVPRRDPIAAACACAKCQPLHALALSGRPEVLELCPRRHAYRPDPSAYRDATRPSQADGF